MSTAVRRSPSGVGRLTHGFNVSVDGYIADAQGNIDWSVPSEELHQHCNDFEPPTETLTPPRSSSTSLVAGATPAGPIVQAGADRSFPGGTVLLR
ncbi:hypothetical protein MLIT_08050 [Mycolicibacterium litorale]|uniref:Dihydrofolate reductase n=1 Tax=Mycolicibacterium litorale TaxID=758802 RepID=A0AAD1IP52_9MYCO|nr:hypothetical protein MLIT_08050 [Mycolicibacterium litorale]